MSCGTAACKVNQLTVQFGSNLGGERSCPWPPLEGFFPGNYQGKSITSPKRKRQTENQRQTRCVNCSASGSYPTRGPAFQSRTPYPLVNGARASLFLVFRQRGQ